MPRKPKTQGPFAVESVALTALIPYAANSRTHDETQVAQIAASMKEFGWTNPVLIDPDNGIIAGHGRVLAAMALRDGGVSSLPNLDDIERIPCIRLGHLTDVQRRAYIIADNRLAENAGWDYPALTAELARLADEDFDATLTGFSSDEIDAMLDGGEVPNLDDLGDQYGDHDGSSFWPTIRVQVPQDVMQRFDDVMADVQATHDWEKLDRILAAVDRDQLNQP